VIGTSAASQAAPPGRPSLSLADVRRLGPREAARRTLRAIPAAAAVLLHFDVDVLRESEWPAAYFPHPDGLTLQEARELLGGLLADPRIRLVEVSEYASLRDPDRRRAGELVDLLAGVLRPAA
jgi:arginase